MLKRTVILILIAIGLVDLPLAVWGANPILSQICANVDCLNNFTGKTGYSFAEHTVMAGGFTDLEKSWYVSPAPGFDVPVTKGPSTGLPLLDLNVVFKFGQLMSDKIPYVHTLVNSDPFVAGLMKYTTIGESGGWDYTGTPNKFFDLTWFGATVTF
jgi:hypothetical protein